MAAMPREAVNDVLELGAALGTGAALHWYGKQRPSVDDIVPLVVNLAVAGAGVFGAMALRGPAAFVAEGVATAGVALTGARLVDMFQAQQAGGGTRGVGRYGRIAYRAPSYAYRASVTPAYAGAGSTGNAVIEI